MKRLVLLLLLAGCSSQPPEGLIAAKKFTAAHNYIVLMPFSNVDPNGNVTTTFIPMVFWEPDRYSLTIEPYDSEGMPLPVRVFLVKESVYSGVAVGNWFKMSDDHADTTRGKKQ